MEQIYLAVAKKFATEILQGFSSEESLKNLQNKQMGDMPLDRTNGWNWILRDILSECWKSDGPEVKMTPTGFDTLSVLEQVKQHSLLDYNLFTQVQLNLSAHRGYSYDAFAARRRLDEIGKEYEGKKESPLLPKAKMIKVASSENDKKFNLDLSAAKALKIIEKFGLSNSYRVSPIGATPAFADTYNLSMIGSGGDEFFRVSPTFQVFYILWPSAPRMISIDLATGGLHATGISYPFFSKSGGDTLNEVLFARYMAFEALKGFDLTKVYVDVLPRMNSLMILTGEASTIPQEIFDRLSARVPGLTFSVGSRPK